MKRLPAALLFALLLAACQSAPPVPENKYYRLQNLVATPATSPLLKAEVTVLPLKAEGLYSERAMVFAGDGGRQLQQYHYHHWLYPPAQLVQEFLAVQLRQAGLSNTVQASERLDETQYIVSGRVIHFERIAVQNKALVKLELRLEKKGKRLWQQTYSAEEAMAENSIPAFVLATESALQRIANEFVAHLRTARLD